MMRVEIIDNPDHFPQFEPQNVFQTKEYMRLFEHEKGTKVVLFAVYSKCIMHNAQCTISCDTREQRSSLQLSSKARINNEVVTPHFIAKGSKTFGSSFYRQRLKDLRFLTPHSSLLLLLPLTIHRYYRHLPGKFASYAVAWREPWRNPEISDIKAQEAFAFLSQAIEKYCRPRALYLEYRHFSEDNIYHDILINCPPKLEKKRLIKSKCKLSTFNSQLFIANGSKTVGSTFKLFPWYNIYRKFDVGADVTKQMNKTKQRQLRQSLAAGVQIVHNPTDEQIAEWYTLLQRLYRRIHRPLPSCQLFLRLNQSSIGKLILITHQGKVISGSAMLVFKRNNSHVVYEYYRASTPDKLQGIYPSVVATWQELQYAADQGAQFDFMGAGPQNKPYGVRDFKLTFGGELTKEYRYRKYLLF